MTSPHQPALNPCGCCQPDAAPQARFNRPGLPAVAYRLGAHGSFLQRMVDRLRAQTVGDSRPLEPLTGRSAADDPSVALLDATAVMADVFSFYQERIANEGFLGTATERRSILEMARSIGYELAPGVAAGAYLVFTVSEAATMPRSVTVLQGSQVQSIPPQGQLPQTFETDQEFTALRALNALSPQLSRTQPIVRGATRVYLAGVATNLQVGDPLLVVGPERETRPYSERWDVRYITAVAPDPVAGHTIVTLDDSLGHEAPDVLPTASPKVYALRQRASLFGHNAPDWRVLPPSVRQGFNSSVNPDVPSTWGTQWPNFEISTLDPPRIDLDAAYPKIMAGGWVVLSQSSYVELYRAVTVVTESRTDFTLTAKCSRITLDSRSHLTWFPLRETVVLAQSEELPLAPQPVTEPVFGDQVVTDALVEGLEEGKVLVFNGKPPGPAQVMDLTRVVRRGQTEETRTEPPLTLTADDGAARTLTDGELLEVVGLPVEQAGGALLWRFRTSDGFEGTVSLAAGSEAVTWTGPAEDADPVSEVATVKTAVSDGRRVTITLEQPLANLYHRGSLLIHGNVVKASHGESVAAEVMGSGDASLSNQRFKLRKPPLTFVSAATASGASSTLAVRVEGVLWEEAASLYGQDPHRASYMVRLDNEANAWVVFGDGVSGARLPSGPENVRARYRTGIGVSGQVAAGSLSLLKTRPLGLQSVTNPLAAAGAENPESLDDARANAPKTVLTLDRIVSLVDFEDFGRAFAGIAKAQASEIWRGETHLVHLTVAATSGTPIANSPELLPNLVAAILASCDPSAYFEVGDYTPLEFSVSAKVLVDPRYEAEVVLEAVGAALSARFSFDQRGLGQPVTGAEVITTVHSVPGVTAVDVDALHLSDESPGAGATPASVLPAARAQLDEASGLIAPAQLLVISATGISLSLMEVQP